MIKKAPRRRNIKLVKTKEFYQSPLLQAQKTGLSGKKLLSAACHCHILLYNAYFKPLVNKKHENTYN